MALLTAALGLGGTLGLYLWQTHLLVVPLATLLLAVIGL